MIRFSRNFSAARRKCANACSKRLGSGVIVRADGLILTNNHVVEGGTDIVVALSDKREFKAKVLLADPRTDLAVLKIDTKGERLPVVAFADSDQVQVGDLVLAIGDPFGVGQTVTMGIVSALARTQGSATDYQFFIQTDAAINPGNSGGALVTTDGKLAGINTAIYSRSGGNIGIGFAIPANLVRRVVEGVEGGQGVKLVLDRRHRPAGDQRHRRQPGPAQAGRRADQGYLSRRPARQCRGEKRRCRRQRWTARRWTICNRSITASPPTSPAMW